MMPASIDVVAAVIASVLVIVWLVRLESRVNTKADSTQLALVIAQVQALADAVKAHEGTRDEVIRLQEQIKTLIRTVERWGPPGPSRGRSGGD